MQRRRARNFMSGRHGRTSYIQSKYQIPIHSIQVLEASSPSAREFWSPNPKPRIRILQSKSEYESQQVPECQSVLKSEFMSLSLSPKESPTTLTQIELQDSDLIRIPILGLGLQASDSKTRIQFPSVIYIVLNIFHQGNKKHQS